MSTQTPLAVARALRQIQAHPSVAGVEFTCAGDVSEAKLRVLVSLPSRWQAVGVSPNGTRAEEDVTVVFGPAFPAIAPRFFLRADFDRAHPHLQPRASGLPEPCLLAGSPSELLRSQGMLALVDQLVTWLEKAALVQLIDPAQGWEPMRRDALDDIVVASGESLRGRAKPTAGCDVLWAGYRTVEGKKGPFHAMVVSDQRATLSADLPQILGSRQGAPGIAMVAWSGKRASGEPFIAGTYTPECVTDVAGLHRLADAFGCGDVLAPKLRLLADRLRGKRLPRPTPVAILLIARRPCEVIGEGSPLEICPYVIEVSGSDDLGNTSSHGVRVAAHFHEPSPTLFQRASGLDEAEVRDWALFGCGSVGSKIGVHMTRAGFGPARVVDSKFMLPHNYARHALIPLTDDGGEIPLPKASLMRHALACLGHQTRDIVADISEAALTGATETIAPAGTQFIVNATGSLGVREALAATPCDRARIVETCLLAGGRMAYLSVEGPRSNPSCLDLAALSYAKIAGDSEMSAHAFSAPPSEIAIGSGCASLTFPMSDARLSALTAPMAERVLRLQASGLPNHGEVAIAITPEDGIGQRWVREMVPPFVEARANEGGEAIVRLSADVHGRIEAEVASKPGVETGGVILGRWSDVANSFHIVDLLPAPPDSTFSRHEFRLGVEGLRPALEAFWRRTGGALYALGTWHNHLVASGPSALDAKTAAALAIQQFFPVLLLIHTPAGYRFMTAEAVYAEEDEDAVVRH